LIRDKEHSQHDFAKAFDYPHTFRARSDAFTIKTTWPAARYVEDILAHLSMIVISASPASSTRSHSPIGLFDKDWNEGSASCCLLFLAGITDSRKLIGHSGKTESNCFLQTDPARSSTTSDQAHLTEIKSPFVENPKKGQTKSFCRL